jgi:hypothetical protein
MYIIYLQYTQLRNGEDIDLSEVEAEEQLDEVLYEEKVDNSQLEPCHPRLMEDLLRTNQLCIFPRLSCACPMKQV